MQEQLNLLIEKHCASIQGTVAEIGELLKRVDTNSSTNGLTIDHDAEALAHQLKGSSGTAGFREISVAATALDDHLKVLCRGEAESVAGGMGKAMELFGRLDQATRGITPSASSLYRAA